MTLKWCTLWRHWYVTPLHNKNRSLRLLCTVLEGVAFSECFLPLRDAVFDNTGDNVCCYSSVYEWNGTSFFFLIVENREDGSASQRFIWLMSRWVKFFCGWGLFHLFAFFFLTNPDIFDWVIQLDEELSVFVAGGCTARTTFSII